MGGHDGMTRFKFKITRRLYGSNKKDKRFNYKKTLRNKDILNNNIVINLSSQELSITELAIINKGLGFVPTHLKPKYNTINEDILRFERRLQLHYYFRKNNITEPDSDDQDVRPIKSMLESNSTWWPKKLNGHITKFCDNVKSSIFVTLAKQKVKNNLSPAEIEALKSLKNNTKITIKKADKGGGIAVLDTDAYISQINNMLSDVNTYKLTDIDDTACVFRKANELIAELVNAGLLNKKQFQYLTNFKARCPIFHGLPKVHKKGIPLRPICSQVDAPTCRINELVDKYLYIAERNIPFLLQDTTAYLLLLDKFKHVLPGTILVTMDVTSLYTNIPHVEGTDWVSDFYCDTLPLWGSHCAVLKPVDRDTLQRLMLFILQSCTFEFNEHYYTQLYGTTMGAKFSVKFANIYMHMWLSKFVGLYKGFKPEFIARLIDDCFFLWTHGIDELNKFITYLNNCHSSIKFEVNYSHEKVCFLDTVTFITNNTIHTTIYTKPTDKKQYLFFNSSHPKHTTRAIPYSQAIRYRRIIDDDDLLEDELTSLYSQFLSRGYPVDLLNHTMAKIKDIPRSAVLQYKNKNIKQNEFTRYLRGRSFLPIIIPYHQSFEKNLPVIINNYWLQMLSGCSKINNIFKEELPQIVYKRGVTIGNLLTATKCHSSTANIDNDTIAILQALELHNGDLHVTPCFHALCKCCNFINATSTFYNTDRDTVYYIDGVFNCNSTDVIYVISCIKCNKLYVGQTGRMLKDRINNHRSDIRLKKATAVSIHFNGPHHSLNDVRVTPIYDISSLSHGERLKVEYEFMKLINTFYPVGMNNYPIV
jgi:hypothetical protein